MKFYTDPIPTVESELQSECWYCGEHHITSEWKKLHGVAFSSPCEVGHSPTTKVEGFKTICLTPPIFPQEEEVPQLISQEEFCSEDWDTDFTRDQYLCRVGDEWFVSRMYHCPRGYYVQNRTGQPFGAFKGDEEFKMCCDEIWLLPYKETH